jgi:hypothetical protein
MKIQTHPAYSPEIGVGRSNFKFGVLTILDESADSHAKIEICTPDPSAATPFEPAPQRIHKCKS